MGSRLLVLQRLRNLASSALLHLSPRAVTSPSAPALRSAIVSSNKCLKPFHPFEHHWAARWISYESVNLVLSDDGKPKFEIDKVEPSKRKGYLTKKRLKLQRKREKRKRKEANKNDPRRIRPKGKKKKQKFPTAEARIKYKIEKAKLKEAMLVERLKKYEVPKVQGPMVKPDKLTGEEQFYLKKISQKKSNYVPVGRRGIFGGVILNMHLHWKKHETVKVICKPCKPGQVQEYASEIARLSGGIPIHIIGDDTIVFYRGKNYVQPDIMSPVDTLSKKKALEKSKYEQSLETVRRFIAISEKELELYYRHVALYGDPQTRNADLVYGDDRKASSKMKRKGLDQPKKETRCLDTDNLFIDQTDEETASSTDLDISNLSDVESDPGNENVFSDEESTEAETDTECSVVSDHEVVLGDKEDALQMPSC